MPEIEVIIVVRDQGKIVETATRHFESEQSAATICAAIAPAPELVTARPIVRTEPSPASGPPPAQHQLRLADLPPAQVSMWRSLVDELADDGRVWAGWAELDADAMYAHRRTSIAIARLVELRHSWPAERVIEYGPLRVLDVVAEVRRYITAGQAIDNPAGAVEQMLRKGPPRNAAQEKRA